MVLAAVAFDQILEVVVVSLVAGVGVSGLFATVILGSARASEAQRTGEGSAALYGAMAAVALVAFLGAVVFGISVILQKS